MPRRKCCCRLRNTAKPTTVRSRITDWWMTQEATSPIAASITWPGLRKNCNAAKRSKSKGFRLTSCGSVPGCAIYARVSPGRGLYRHERYGARQMEVVQDVYAFHWKVEQFHGETKQLTGVEGCQCRKAHLVRNWGPSGCGCAILV